MGQTLGCRRMGPYVAPLMRGGPGCRGCRAHATALSPVGRPWPGTEAASPRGYWVPLCATTAFAGAVPCWCFCGAGGSSGGFGPVLLLVAPAPLLSLPCIPRSACSGLPRPGAPCPRLLVRHSRFSVCSASSVWLPLWCALRVRCVVVCSRSCGVRVSPLPLPFCAHTSRGERLSLITPRKVLMKSCRFCSWKTGPQRPVEHEKDKDRNNR